MKKQFNFQLDTKGVYLDVYGYQEGTKWEVTSIKLLSGEITLNKMRIGAVCLTLENAICKEVLNLIMATGELNVIISDAVNKHLGIEELPYVDVFGQLSDLNPQPFEKL